MTDTAKIDSLFKNDASEKVVVARGGKVERRSVACGILGVPNTCEVRTYSLKAPSGKVANRVVIFARASVDGKPAGIGCDAGIVGPGPLVVPLACQRLIQLR